MKKRLRIVAIATVALLAFLVVLPFFIDANQFRPRVEAELSRALGREVKVADLKLSIFSGGVTAGDLSITDDPGYSRVPFVTAKSLHLGVDLPALIFSRKLIVTRLTIDRPRITLLQSPSGDWNFSNLGARRDSVVEPAPPANGKSSLDLSVRLVKISDGTFTVGRTGSRLKPVVLEKVDASLRDFAAASTFPFSLSMEVAGGGTVHLDGRAGPIDQTDVAATPASISVKVAHLDLVTSGLNETAPSVAALVSFEGSGESTGKDLHLKGRLKAEKLKLAASGVSARRAVELDFAVAHDLKKRSGVVKQADIHIGRALSRLTGTYAAEGDSTALNMHFTGESMSLPELIEMLPALGLALPKGSSLQGGTVTVRASMAGPLDRLVTVGSVSLNNTRLAGFNMPQRMSSIERLAGIKGGPDTEIQELSTQVRVTTDGMNAEAIKLVVPAIGNLEGAGVVTPASTLNFEMRATVHTSGFATIVNNTPIPFTVEGTCSEPVFKPNLKAVVKEEFKELGGDIGKAATGLVHGLFGGKKKD